VNPQWLGKAGTVQVRLTIASDGSPVVPVILESMGPDMDRACLAAVSRWHFSPAMASGKPVETEGQISINFERNP
jgi:TonB family protein